MVDSSTGLSTRLKVVSLAVSEQASLLEFAHPFDPLVWLRGGSGMVGVGVAARLDFAAANGLADAARVWRSFCEGVEVDDRVGVPGSGLVAFGTFPFSRSSSSTGTLVVPRIIVGHRDGMSWVTHVSEAEDAAPLPPRLPIAPLDSPATFIPGALTPEGFAALVATMTERIASGDARKVVLARDVATSIPANTDLRAPLSKLLAGYEQCWTYAVDGMIGASPETLVTVAGGTVTSRVLAGTIPRNPSGTIGTSHSSGTPGTTGTSDTSAADTLAESAKDHEEHAYAVESVLEALADYCDNLTASEAPYLLELPNVFHLATDVRGTLGENSSSLALAHALHPTAAVAGTPTPAALALIEQAEPLDRGRYAGPVGWVDAAGNGEWAIALRGAQVGAVRDGTREVHAHAGCGLVASSDPQTEVLETDAKLAPMVGAFGA